jgi:ornithine decarboxylase
MDGPRIIIDLDKVRQNHQRIRDAFGPRFGVYFSVKANNHPEVLRTLAMNGCGFDVASASEIDDALSAGARPHDIAFSNPIKIPKHIDFAYARGVRLFALDSEDEVMKLAIHAPGSAVYVRLRVDNTGSGWPLSGKFGVEVSDAVALLASAKTHGLDPAGVTFHVGSQCEHLVNWRMALERASEVWRGCARLGITLRLLNIGGGLPAAYRRTEPSVEDVATEASRAVSELFPDATMLMLEPGRAMVADAGVLETTVIGTAMRGHERIIYLDVGVFSGLMETYECFWYPVVTTGSGPEETVTLAGPTCDSVDIISRNVRLPKLQMGDRVRFEMSGAYTNSYERYNGFGFPEVVLASINQKKEAPKGARIVSLA